MTDWSNRTALITGAGTGIGKAIALALAARGASLWLVGRTAATLDDVAKAARATGGSAHTLVADLTRDDDVDRIEAALAREGGHLDLLVHCAAVLIHGTLGSAAIDDLDAHYRANLRAPYRLTQSLLPMLVARHGEIVFMNSTIVGRAPAGLGGYTAAKAGLKAIADTVREEINESGVRVLSVFPGRTATPRQEAIHALEGKEYRPDELIQPEDVAAMVLSALELPRTAEVTEISMRPFVKPPA